MLEKKASHKELDAVSDYLTYFRKGDFKKSKISIENISNDNDSPLQNFVELMIARNEEMANTPLPKDWEGVFTAQTK